MIYSIFIAPFANNAFMQNALLAGVLVSISAGIVGTFVVLRGLAFIGDALSHGVLPGIALAVLLGFPAMAGAAVGSLVMIGGIGYISKKTRLSSDTAIGLLFVGMLALGVIIVSRSRSFSGDLVKMLFGEILGTSAQGIVIQAISCAVLVVLARVFYRPFLLLCFSEEQAQVSGFNAKFYHGVMLVMIALTVVVSFQTVGTMLVFGMLLAPASASALFSRRLAPMMTGAALVGAVSVYAGLLVSYHANLAAGASITLCAVLFFFIALIARGLMGRKA